MLIQNIKFNNLTSFTGKETATLIKVGPYYLYDKAGNKTSEVGGTNYVCVLPQMQYEQLAVKVPKQPAVIAQEDITPETQVRFEGFVGKFYRTKTGEYAFTSLAEKVILVKGDEGHAR